MSKVKNRKAFPFIHKWENSTGVHLEISKGMELKEWYAGLAMKSIITASLTNEKTAQALMDMADKYSVEHLQHVALMASNYADALVKQLEKD